MSRYAEGTKVPVEKSQAEIRRIVRRWGACEFALVETDQAASIQFSFNSRKIRLGVLLPDFDDYALTHNGTRRRSPESQEKAWDQGCRQRWRALALFVKANLEAVEEGVADIEKVFFPYLVLPNGKTVAETLGGNVYDAIDTGHLQLLALAPPEEAES